MSESVSSYKFVRMADRNGVCRGSNMYASCPDCGGMVRLLPWEHCGCGHVAVGETPGGKCFLSGGTGPVELYWGVQAPSEPVVETYFFPPVEPDSPKRRFRMLRMGAAALFVLAIFFALYLVLYTRIGVVV